MSKLGAPSNPKISQQETCLSIIRENTNSKNHEKEYRWLIQAQSNYQVGNYNSCNIYFDFLDKAKTKRGLVLAINIEATTAQFFHIIFEPEINDYLVVDLPLPTGSINTLNAIKDIKSWQNSITPTSFSGSDVQMLNAPNGCGAAGGTCIIVKPHNSTRTLFTGM